MFPHEDQFAFLFLLVFPLFVSLRSSPQEKLHAQFGFTQLPCETVIACPSTKWESKVLDHHTHLDYTEHTLYLHFYHSLIVVLPCLYTAILVTASDEDPMQNFIQTS